MKSEWISVKDEMPEENLKVLVALDDGRLAADFVEASGYAWYSNTRVTHWMPLPEPPKEGENGKAD